MLSKAIFPVFPTPNCFLLWASPSLIIIAQLQVHIIDSQQYLSWNIPTSWLNGIKIDCYLYRFIDENQTHNNERSTKFEVKEKDEKRRLREKGERGLKSKNPKIGS